MEFGLSEELVAMKELARDFAQKEIAPTVEEDEKTHRFRPERVRQMGSLGFFGVLMPEAYGGTSAGFLASALMTEEVARVSNSWALPFNLQTMGPGTAVLANGTEDQKREYIPKWVSGEYLGCFAITEPGTGSDVASMKTTATEDGDWYVLNGNKMWISNAHVADAGIVYACTDRSAKAKGISAFIVELKNTPGITTVPIETKMGLPCSPTGEIIFENARVPKSALLGEKGAGFKICMAMLDNTRVGCSARALGVGGAALEHSVRYANEREQFGKPIADFQMIQDQIANMYVEHEAAKLLVYRAAWLKDQGVRCTCEVSCAKYFAAEACVNAANTAVKIFGSYGFSTEYPVERLYRDCKSFQIVEGTSNVQKMIISGFALGRRK